MPTSHASPYRAAIRAYYLLAGGSAFCYALAFTISSVYRIERARLDPLQLVLVGTALELSIFLAEVPTGALADLRGRRLSILVGLVLIGCGFLLEGALPLFATIVLAQVLWGVGYTFTSGADKAWIADEVGEERVVPVFLRGAQAAQVGALAGIVLSALLAGLRLNLPILAAGGLFLALALALWRWIPERSFQPRSQDGGRAWTMFRATLSEGARVTRRHPVLLTLLGVGALWGLASEGFDRLWTLHLLRAVTLPPFGPLPPVAWFGLIQAVTLVLSLAATELTRRRLKAGSYPAIARALTLLTGLQLAAMLTFAASGALPLALAGYWSVMLLRQVNEPLYAAWINQGLLPSSVRATVLSISSQADALGQVAGGPLVGLIGLHISVQAALGTSAGALIPAVLLLLVAARHQALLSARRPRVADPAAGDGWR